MNIKINQKIFNETIAKFPVDKSEALENLKRIYYRHNEKNYSFGEAIYVVCNDDKPMRQFVGSYLSNLRKLKK